MSPRYIQQITTTITPKNLYIYRKQQKGLHQSYEIIRDNLNQSARRRDDKPELVHKFRRHMVCVCKYVQTSKLKRMSRRIKEKEKEKKRNTKRMRNQKNELSFYPCARAVCVENSLR